METSLSALIEWLNAHEPLILFAIALLSFLESLAIVGILVPGVALLFAAGTAAGSAELSVLSVLLSAFAGAVIGDGLSFLLGYHYHEWIRKVPPFSTHPQWISKGETFFRQYGLMGIVIGRFVGPIRPVMPLVAGLMQMPPIKFFTVNILSALAWAPFYLMPGYVIGASLEGDHTLSGRHLAFLLGMIVIGWLLGQLLWWAHQHIHQRRDKLRLSLTIAITCACGLVASSQLMQLTQVIAWNQQVAFWSLNLRHDWLDIFFVGLTQFGDLYPMILWGALVTVALVLQRNLYATALWVSSLLIGQALLSGLKNAFAWPRPALTHTPPESYAFPSGHTTMALLFFGTLLILLLPGISAKRQKAIISAACIVVMTIAASRLYLTVHWVTDILGGLLVSGTLLALLYAWVLKHPFRQVRPAPLMVASGLAWGISAAVWLIPEFNHAREGYQTLIQPLIP